MSKERGLWRAREAGRFAKIARFAVLVMVLAVCATQTRAAPYFQAPLLTQFCYGKTTVQNPASLSVADLNVDGIPDFIAPCFGGGVGVFLGTSTGLPLPLMTVPGPNTAEYSATGDFDADGAPDFAGVGYPSGSVFFGDGSGTSWSVVALPIVTSSGVVAGDFDEDGVADLVVMESTTRTLKTLLARSGRTFQVIPLHQDSIPTKVWGMHASDLNSDGHLDLVITGDLSDFPLMVMLGTGDGGFSPATPPLPPPFQFRPGGFDIADITADGILDLVVANRYGGIVRFDGIGNGGFGQGQVTTLNSFVGVNHVVAGDFTGDGAVDIAFPSDFTPEWDGGARLVTMERNIFGNLQQVRTPFVGHRIFAPVPVDVDGDERLDLVSLDLEVAAIAISRGDGLGGFGDGIYAATSPVGGAASCIGDLNRDGLPDVVTLQHFGSGYEAETRVRTSLAYAPRMYASAAGPTILGTRSALLCADFNHDGALDVLIPEYYSRLTVLPGNGNGGFGSLIYTYCMITSGIAITFDANQDSIPDVVSAKGDSLQVFLGLGDGHFEGLPHTSYMGLQATQLVAGDLNSDGRADLAYYGYSSTLGDTYGYSRSNGDGTLTKVMAAYPHIQVQGLVVCDANSDERLDLVAAVKTCSGCLLDPMRGRLYTHLQEIGGTLASAIESPWPYDYGTLALSGDFDLDGKVDLLNGQAGSFFLSKGIGDGHFDSSDIGYAALGHGAAQTVADMDLDGKLDVVTNTLSNVMIYYGRDCHSPSSDASAMTAAAPLSIGATRPLRWTATDDEGVATVDLFVSRHGRHGPFAAIARDLPNTGELAWTVTGPASDSVAFKVVARDAAGNAGVAISPGLASITAENVAVGPEQAVGHRTLAIESVLPNPVTTRTSIRFGLPRAGSARLSLHDLQGREVARLWDGEREAGSSTVEWRPGTTSQALSPGVYFLRLTSDGASTSTRIVLTQ